MTEEDEEFQRLEREVEMRRMVVRRMAEEDDDTQVYKKPWVNLTDEEISKIIDAEIGFNSCWGPEEQFARAIEAKLKEKNA